MTNRQKRQVSKVLLDGLYDPEAKLLGISTEVMGDHLIIWQKLVENLQIFPDPANPAWL